MTENGIAGGLTSSQSLFSRDSLRFVSWATLSLTVVTVVVLVLMGRVFWCKCGGWNVWSGDIWTMHNSQHVLDPYSFTHVLHGLLFCGILHFLPNTVSQPLRYTVALTLEAGWEILENTPFIIERYRETTISLDYYGDSIINSVSDILACAFGYFLAARLGLWKSVIVIVLIELALLITIRDSLALNIIMLIYPIEAILEWQMG